MVKYSLKSFKSSNYLPSASPDSFLIWLLPLLCSKKLKSMLSGDVTTEHHWKCRQGIEKQGRRILLQDSCSASYFGMTAFFKPSSLELILFNFPKLLFPTFSLFMPGSLKLGIVDVLEQIILFSGKRLFMHCSMFSSICDLLYISYSIEW